MTDLEQYRPSGIVPIEYDLDELLRKAQVLAKSGLVRRALNGKPEAIAAVALRGGELGVSLMTALDEIDVIEGKTYLSAQLCSSLSRAAGHEIEVRETTRDRCLIVGRRRDARHRPDAWQPVEWTRERAREAGLLDVWVERYHKEPGDNYARRQAYVIGNDLGIDDKLVAAAPEWAATLIDAGALKRKDNWYRHPVEMLRARATRELCRMAFGDVLIGLDVADDDVVEHLDAPDDAPPVAPDERAAEDERAATIVDAEVVEDVAPAGEHDATPAQSDGTGSTSTSDASRPDPDAALAWDVDAWAEHLRDADINPAKALKAARLAAVNLNLDPPMNLGEIDDARIAAVALDPEAA